MNAFPQELRSKRIYRIAGGYVVSAWLVLQVASVIAPSLALPAWTLRALLGVLLLGFSVALFAGWRLDVRAAKATKLPVNFHLMVWPTRDLKTVAVTQQRAMSLWRAILVASEALRAGSWEE